MSVATPTRELNRPRTTAALHTCRQLLGAYLMVSLLTLAGVVLLRNHSNVVNAAVWIRTSVVAASSVITYVIAIAAARGSRGAYRRLRILTGVMVVAIAVIIALPGTFPLWLKLEQGLCGLILLGVVAIVNRQHVRELFVGR